MVPQNANCFMSVYKLNAEHEKLPSELTPHSMEHSQQSVMSTKQATLYRAHLVSLPNLCGNRAKLFSRPGSADSSSQLPRASSCSNCPPIQLASPINTRRSDGNSVPAVSSSFTRRKPVPAIMQLMCSATSLCSPVYYLPSL